MFDIQAMSMVFGCLWFQNVRYSNGPPSHMTFPFEYRIPIVCGIQVVAVCDFVTRSGSYCLPPHFPGISAS